MTDTLRRKAKTYGAEDLVKSWRKGKKWAVLYKDKWIHFGAIGYDDFTIHKDKDRRKNYRARASGIKNKEGKLTYKIKTSANFWAYNILW
jgi:hypothetical protein